MLARLLAALAGALTMLALAAGPAAAGPLTGRALVLLERPHGTGAHAAAARAFLARTGARRDGPAVPELGLVTVAVPAGKASAFTARLRRDPDVRSVQLERRHALRYRPNDPALSAPDPAAGSAPFQWPAEREGLFGAWDVARGFGALVAVIDSGIDANHPDLAGRIVAAVDHDDLDSSHGPATSDENGHGTHVAALACGNADNGVGVAGAGFSCGLIVEKSDLSDSSVAASIVDATDRGADAISMSFGTDGSQPPAQAIVDALQRAHDRGVVLVAAAANEDTEQQGDPANVLQPTGTGPDAASGIGLSVTAADAHDRRAIYGETELGTPKRPGRGTQISLAAYGFYDETSGPHGIFSAFPANQTDIETGSGSLAPALPCDACRTTFLGDNRYAYLGGTSMATPQVAGAAALLRALNPDLPVDRLLQIIKTTARQPGGGGWNAELGWGILDAGAAAQRVRREDATPPATDAEAPTRATAGARVLIRLGGADRAPEGVLRSGLRQVRLYGRRGSGPVRRLATAPRAHPVRVRLARGTWRLWSVGVDHAGNREGVPGRADAIVKVR
jgi:subtilisin family serine protease